MKSTVLIFLLLSTFNAVSQLYTASSIFAHNDYAKANPFYNAYEKRVGYMEADVFLRDDNLFVAHYQLEIKKENTLEGLYLMPLQKAILKNRGWAYPDSTMRLTLMIDLKSDGLPTIHKLVERLRFYPELLTCPTLEIVLSGNVPPTSAWDSIPAFIKIDGRPENFYTEEQLNRVRLISTNFRSHVKWKGDGKLTEKDEMVIRALVKEVHSKGKKLRFWAAPDSKNAWLTLMKLDVDVIGTDSVDELVKFIK
jgi:alkaline phosphatase